MAGIGVCEIVESVPGVRGCLTAKVFGGVSFCVQFYWWTYLIPGFQHKVWDLVVKLANSISGTAGVERGE